MADIVTTLASQVGVEPEKIQKALGAVLSFLRSHLGPEAFSKVEGAIPGAAGMASASESRQEGGGQGLLGSVASLAGKALGGAGGKGATLMAGLSQSGLDANQIQAFLTRVVEFLRGHLPPDLMQKIEGLLPLSSPPAGAGGG